MIAKCQKCMIRVSTNSGDSSALIVVIVGPHFLHMAYFDTRDCDYLRQSRDEAHARLDSS